MEPNCAICNGPAYRQCPCEHQSLILAVEQSEQRVLHPMWDEIRYWVTTQTKAEIHRDFQARSSYRRAQHSAFLSQNTGRFTNELLDRVNRDLQRGIDDDWRAAVQRYPEVLDYFYSMVAWTVRGDCMSPGAGTSAGGPMLSPRSDLPSPHGEGYFSGRGMGGLHIPCDHSHGPLPYTSPIGGGGGIDRKHAPTRPFYGRTSSYGSVYSASSSGYATGSGPGSISPSSSSSPGRDSRQKLPPVHFPSYAYGRPPAQVYRP